MWEIISYAVKGLTRFWTSHMHVSRLWCKVVNGMSVLLTEVDWDHWPGELDTMDLCKVSFAAFLCVESTENYVIIMIYFMCSCC